MNNDRHKQLFLLKRAKYLLLLLSGVMIFANLYVVSATRQHVESFTEQQSQATWFLFQLNKEFSELNAILPYAHLDPEVYQKALLKYELTWSRFDILLTSREAETFINLPGAMAFFTHLFNQYKQLESQIELINQPTYAASLTEELNAIYLSMIEYVNTHFRVQSPTYINQLAQAKKLNGVLLTTLLLLVFGVVLVTYILHKESQIHRQQSLTDTLTGIGNRLALFEDLSARIERQTPFSFLLLDLNSFKPINDHYGHQAGDRVLRTIASRLNTMQIDSYRIGGDEFAIVAQDLSRHQLQQLIETLHQQVGRPIAIDDSHIKMSTSIGAACFPIDAKQINHLMLLADERMYSEKRSKYQDYAEQS
ncbi:GGDEF domain-containing protein [Vibrio sinaloensis]|uniref:GGDEF domain-containing protein n=1 Tax=Photobacterium sp. (strain ATCC 43367) TaxID=379097 RepID=UPI0020570D5C|nr:GGDEF domain-containing protein [Vibrio sinaloensis]UPQ90186.1 GGDEF domain-containing protein [Vibrio sinaloensis]